MNHKNDPYQSHLYASLYTLILVSKAQSASVSYCFLYVIYIFRFIRNLLEKFLYFDSKSSISSLFAKDSQKVRKFKDSLMRIVSFLEIKIGGALFLTRNCII